MQNLPIYKIDAFTEDLFAGNPAAVVPLPEFLSDDLMQNIAKENNLSETAFVVVKGKGKFDIRWFTPTNEARLCGHATLAAAHVMYTASDEEMDKMRFKTREAGTITVTARTEDGSNNYSMSFAADVPKKIRAPRGLRDILGGVRPVEIWRGQDDLVVLLRNRKQVESVTPNFPMLATLTQYRGLIITAPDKEFDFVSRGFFPAIGVNEDPVTGSAHTVLTPFWSERLKKRKMVACQVSDRGGKLTCEYRGQKVRLTGRAVTYLSGQLMLE